jgi:hypothetical protein
MGTIALRTALLPGAAVPAVVPRSRRALGAVAARTTVLPARAVAGRATLPAGRVSLRATVLPLRAVARCSGRPTAGAGAGGAIRAVAAPRIGRLIIA